MQLQDLIDQYAKLNQRIREQVLLSKAYDQEYQSTVEKNVTAKSLIQSFIELNGYVIGHYQIKDLVTDKQLKHTI